MSVELVGEASSTSSERISPVSARLHVRALIRGSER
jgi:hypothetical protein